MTISIKQSHIIKKKKRILVTTVIEGFEKLYILVILPYPKSFPLRKYIRHSGLPFHTPNTKCVIQLVLNLVLYTLPLHSFKCKI